MKNIKTRPAFFILPRSVFLFSFRTLACFFIAPACAKPSSPFYSRMAGESKKRQLKLAFVDIKASPVIF